MEVAETIERVRNLVAQARHHGKRIGLVPTMGALHRGHVSLIEAASEHCDFVVVTIFVNPTQFGPGEDFDKYPRPLDNDLQICRQNAVDVVFAPTPREMYGDGSLTWVTVERLQEPLCGRFRPGHFRGVATVCAKLFNIVAPDLAFFGQKDGQQVAVIRRMVADLNMPLEIVVCPTVREPDGLALSSRNQYLSPAERRHAPKIYQALQKAESMIRSGAADPRQVVAQMQTILQQIPDSQIEYAGIVDSQTLQEVERISGKVMVAVALRLPSARLIDNIVIDTAAV